MNIPRSDHEHEGPREAACSGNVSETAGFVPDWPAIRPVYERDLDITLEGICRRFGISKRALQKKIEDDGWTPRRPRRTHRARSKVVRVSRATLISRMFGALERQVTRLEEVDMPPTDKEIVLLGSMSRTLGKLMDIDKSRQKPGKTKAAPSAELSELRKKIAERIADLNQG